MVIAAKTHKVNVTWHKYHWRMCVSYQKQNQVTRTFAFTIPCCNDAVQDINTEAILLIAVDMGIGYWGVVAEYEERERL